MACSLGGHAADQVERGVLSILSTRATTGFGRRPDCAWPDGWASSALRALEATRKTRSATQCRRPATSDNLLSAVADVVARIYPRVSTYHDCISRPAERYHTGLAGGP